MDDSNGRNLKPYLLSGAKTPFIELYLTSFVSACCAESVGYPFDVCKTRLHIQGEIASQTHTSIQHRGMIATGIGIIREEGIRNLYGGVSAMFLRHFVFTGLKMTIYENMRQELMIIDENGRPTLTFLRGAACGMVAGGGANLVSSPTDLIKVQMQMEGKRRLLGEPPRVTNILQAVKVIYTAGGIRGLWKGVGPNCARAALVTLGDVSCYDQTKRNLMKFSNSQDNRWIQFIAAMTAGLMGAILSTPVDVVKSRVMNQPTDESGRGLHYKNSFDCFIKLVRGEGFLAMYKGLIPFWLRAGPWAMVFWTTFENIRYFRGDKGF